MKKLYTLLLLFTMISMSQDAISQERYLDKIFDDVEVTSDIVYNVNTTVLTVLDTTIGRPIPIPLQMDVYQPAGDTETSRPVVFVFHTGNFLPPVLNQQISGTKQDSSVVEFCTEFAKRGYVAVAPNYRTGWNPLATTQPIRVLGLIQAAYRGIQDARIAIRYMRNDAMNGTNQYGIDPMTVTAFGMGTGGYVSLGVSTLDEYAEIVETTNGPAKFILDTDGDGVPDTPMVIEAVHGDLNGEVTTVAPFDFPPYAAGDTTTFGYFQGISSDVQLGINVGGALGDISWVDENTPPIISIQDPFDIFAPYNDATVIVPTTGDPVIRAQGSFAVAQVLDSLGTNQIFKDAVFDDVITQVAIGSAAAADQLLPYDHPYIEGLFPWVKPLNSAGIPEGVVVNWWDPDALSPFGVPWNLLPHPSSTDTMPLTFHTQGLILNEGMSAEKARTNINDIMAYISPRACVALELPCAALFTSSTEDLLEDNTLVNVFPNPATDRVEMRTDGQAMERVELIGIDGKLMFARNNINDNNLNIDISAFDSGMYILKVYFEEGLVTKQIVKE